jgi:hypothetical protein
MRLSKPARLPARPSMEALQTARYRPMPRGQNRHIQALQTARYPCMAGANKPAMPYARKRRYQMHGPCQLSDYAMANPCPLCP